MEFHDLIKVIRKNMGISQKKFAEKLHVSFSTVNRWENGHVMPNQLALATLIELCKKEQVEPKLLRELEAQKSWEGFIYGY